MNHKNKSVVFIGMSYSSHVQAWLNEIPDYNRNNYYFIESTDNKINIEYFQSSGLPITPIIGYSSIPGISTFKRMIFKLIEKNFNLSYEQAVNFLIRSLQRNNQHIVIHYFEFQHAGYLLLRIIDQLNLRSFKNVEIVGTNFGSDIYWYGRNIEHEKRIRSLLKITNFLISESYRDINLANKFGFKGNHLRVESNALGVPDKYLNRNYYLQKYSLRKKIFLKGNFGFVGRLFSLIDIISTLEDDIRINNYEIIVVSLPAYLKEIVSNELSLRGFKYKIYIQGELSRLEIFSILSESRIYMAASLSDGQATTCIEAICFGAVPFQTSSATIFEFKNEFEIIEIDILNLKKCQKQLKEILTNNDLGESISKNNLKNAVKIFSRNKIIEQIREKFTYY